MDGGGTDDVDSILSHNVEGRQHAVSPFLPKSVQQGFSSIVGDGWTVGAFLQVDLARDTSNSVEQQTSKLNRGRTDTPVNIEHALF